MTWNDDALRDAYRREVASGRTSGSDSGTSCPDEDALERYLLGNATAGEITALADHLEVCSPCAGLVQDLGRLRAWADRAAAVRPRPAVAARTWMAMAAVIVLALGVLLVALRTDRSTTDADVVRALSSAVVPEPGAVVVRPPASFDWPDEPGAAGYRLRLYGPRADLLWESEQRVASDCPLPPAVGARLAAGSRYAWTVEVDGPVRRRELGPFGFEIAPE